MMKRREFLAAGSATLAAAATDLANAPAASACSTATSCAGQPNVIRLAITERQVMMIDGQMLNFLAFKNLNSTDVPQVPGPVIQVGESASVSIEVTNLRPETHGFEVVGIPASKICSIPAGATRCVTFTPPVGGAGSYMYVDASHTASRGALYRVLGLHGAFLVKPTLGATDAGSPTPYSRSAHTPSITALFDALGNTARFQGGINGRWVPTPHADPAVPLVLKELTSNQEKIWMLSQVDPKFNALVVRNVAIPANTLTNNLVNNFVPRYFTINGRSGFDLSHGADVVVQNYIGEPTLLRVMNAGLAHHATHIHGNHLLELAHVDLDIVSPTYLKSKIETNIYELDVWAMYPMERKDMLLPLEVPPDIPTFPMSQEPFPLRYVMHCHCEMSQTAAGGNYPQGMVTHWEILGGLGGRAPSSASAGGASAG